MLDTFLFFPPKEGVWGKTQINNGHSQYISEALLSSSLPGSFPSLLLFSPPVFPPLGVEAVGRGTGWGSIFSGSPQVTHPQSPSHMTFCLLAAAQGRVSNLPMVEKILPLPCISSWVKNSCMGISLVVQWLRLSSLNAGSTGLIPGQGTRSHMLQWRSKILCAATKTLSSQINKYPPNPKTHIQHLFPSCGFTYPLGNLLLLWDFFFFFKLFIYLDVLDLHCSVQASHCSGFSCWEAWALGCVGFSSCDSRGLEHRLSSCSTQA